MNLRWLLPSTSCPASATNGLLKTPGGRRSRPSLGSAAFGHPVQHDAALRIGSHSSENLQQFTRRLDETCALFIVANDLRFTGVVVRLGRCADIDVIELLRKHDPQGQEQGSDDGPDYKAGCAEYG